MEKYTFWMSWDEMCLWARATRWLYPLFSLSLCVFFFTVARFFRFRWSYKWFFFSHSIWFEWQWNFKCLQLFERNYPIFHNSIAKTCRMVGFCPAGSFASSSFFNSMYHCIIYIIYNASQHRTLLLFYLFYSCEVFFHPLPHLIVGFHLLVFFALLYYQFVYYFFTPAQRVCVCFHLFRRLVCNLLILLHPSTSIKTLTIY